MKKSIKALPAQLLAAARVFQKDEITAHNIYLKLSKSIKSRKNSIILSKIAREEKIHYEFWRSFTGEDISPSRLLIGWYYWISKILGITFGIKLMEIGEDKAQKGYEKVITRIPGAKKVLKEEEIHEQHLIGIIDEERLEYAGSIVLGLNDALVELTGALAGFTFALQNSRLIALTGLITGIAASFSMAASDYLSKKTEATEKNALKSSVYTGIAYIITVLLLIAPYLFIASYAICLPITLSIAILIILGFNYYISVAKDLNFKHRFIEMAVISLSVSAVSFVIGIIIKQVLGVDI